MNLIPTINQCYAMIVQDESQKALSGDSVEHTILFSNRPRGGPGNKDHMNLSSNKSGNAVRSGGTGYSEGADSSGGSSGARVSQRSKRNSYLFCEFCNKRGHSKEACFKLLQCSWYNIKGHTRDTCYKLIGYPSDFKGKKECQCSNSYTTYI